MYCQEKDWGNEVCPSSYLYQEAERSAVWRVGIMTEWSRAWSVISKVKSRRSAYVKIHCISGSLSKKRHHRSTPALLENLCSNLELVQLSDFGKFLWVLSLSTLTTWVQSHPCNAERRSEQPNTGRIVNNERGLQFVLSLAVALKNLSET